LGVLRVFEGAGASHNISRVRLMVHVKARAGFDVMVLVRFYTDDYTDTYFSQLFVANMLAKI